MAEYDVVENGLGHSQGHQHLCVHVRALPQRHQRQSVLFTKKKNCRSRFRTCVFTVQTSLFKGVTALDFDHLKLLNFSFNVDPDPAFHYNADPDPASKNNADPDPQF